LGIYWVNLSAVTKERRKRKKFYIQKTTIRNFWKEGKNPRQIPLGVGRNGEKKGNLSTYRRLPHSRDETTSAGIKKLAGEKISSWKNS